MAASLFRHERFDVRLLDILWTHIERNTERFQSSIEQCLYRRRVESGCRSLLPLLL